MKKASLKAERAPCVASIISHGSPSLRRIVEMPTYDKRLQLLRILQLLLIRRGTPCQGLQTLLGQSGYIRFNIIDIFMAL